MSLLVLNDQGGSVMSVSYDVTNTLRAQMKHHEPIVCYAPQCNNCQSYCEADKSATLCTKYHYGSGGDAALIVSDEDRKKEPIAFIERAGCEGGGKGILISSIPGTLNTVMNYNVCLENNHGNDSNRR